MNAWRRSLAAAASLVGALGLSVGIVPAAGAASAPPADRAAVEVAATRLAGSGDVEARTRQLADSAPPPSTVSPPSSAPRSTADPARRQQPVGSLPGEPNRALTIIGGLAAVVIVAAGGLTFRWFARRGERAAAAADRAAGRSPGPTESHLR